MATKTTADERTDNEKVKMAEWYAGERDVYAKADGYTILHEDDECAVVADHTGHELNEWADRLDADRERLRRTMRVLAEQKIGEAKAHDVFSYSDPVVFDTVSKQ